MLPRRDLKYQRTCMRDVSQLILLQGMALKGVYSLRMIGSSKSVKTGSLSYF